MECKRCGKCCGYRDSDRLWEKSNLTEEQLKRLEILMDKVPKPCPALAVINGKLTCLVQHYFGYDAKPDVCKKYNCGEQNGNMVKVRKEE